MTPRTPAQKGGGEREGERKGWRGRDPLIKNLATGLHIIATVKIAIKSICLYSAFCKAK